MAKKKTGGSRRRASKPTQSETVETKIGPSKQFKLPEGPKIEHHLSNAEAWEKKLSDMKGHVKKAYEAAAVDGVSKTLLKELMALKGGDPIIARQHLEAYGVGLKVIGAPFQLNVFDTMFENDVAQAKAEGALAGRQGKGMECRFAEGSPAADAYAEAYMFEQAKRVPGADKLSDPEIKEALAAQGQDAPVPEKKPAPKLEVVH